jgi:4-amino-4-deoxy-L-arabinose transferase-like glycosyltransferase
MKPRNMLFLFLGLLTLLRLVYISQAELVADEAYYYMWSQRLDFSYYSKGPGVALAMRLGTAIFGANEFGVRCLSPLLGLGTCLVMFYFARRLYNESVAIWAVLAMNALPIFNVGGVLMTIDPLSIFFWTAALFTFWLALEKGVGLNWYWPLTGLLIGLGFLAKYTNAMQLISIVLVLALTRRFRVSFLRGGFYSLLGAFLVCTLPVVIWNSQHEWITLVHLRSRGNLNTGFAVHFLQPLSFLGGQLGVYSPLIFFGMLMALWWARKDVAARFKPRFLALFALPILIMYGVLSLKKAGQPNWTAPAFISLGILAAAYWHEAMQKKPKRLRHVAWALGIGIFMSLALFSTEMLHSTGIPFPYKYDFASRMHGWKTAAITVGDFRKQFEKETGKPVFLISKNYQTSALLSFYLPDKRVEGPGHPAVYIPESQDIESEFSFWPSYDEFVDAPKTAKPADDYYTGEGGVNLFMGRDALYITDDIDDTPPTSIQRGFERVEMIKLFNITSHGQPLKQIRIFACYNYKTVPL